MIDWTRVTELCEEIGSDDFQEVVDLFLSEVEETLEQMQAEEDACALQATLHFLKGSALNLGFVGLAKLCQAGEKAVIEGQADEVDISALKQAYGAAKHQFLAELSDRLAA